MDPLGDIIAGFMQIVSDMNDLLNNLPSAESDYCTVLEWAGDSNDPDYENPFENLAEVMMIEGQGFESLVEALMSTETPEDGLGALNQAAATFEAVGFLIMNLAQILDY